LFLGVGERVGVYDFAAESAQLRLVALMVCVCRVATYTSGT
jgi:hypothetical protein